MKNLSIKIECNGGFREVGNNAVIFDNGKERVCFEFGFNVSDSLSPLIPKKKVDFLLACHGHLDHVGSIPELYKIHKPKIFGTKPTKDLAELVLYDSIKVGKIKEKPRKFNRDDVKDVLNNWTLKKYNETFKLGSSKVTFYDAGHIPGSTMALLEMDNKKILYTSDFKLNDTALLKGADISKVKNVDMMIMETTYSDRDLEKRDKIEKEFIEVVNKTVEQGGIALVPSFAIRAPELLMVLEKYKVKHNIFVDGMGKAATEISGKNLNFIKDSKMLKRALNKSTFVTNHAQRKKIIKSPCIIITTGGCMDGGPVAEYIKHIYRDEKSSLIMTGYQIPGTAGKYLEDTGRYVTDELNLKLTLPIYKFSFTAHATRSELMDMVKKIRPKKVMCIHGTNTVRFATEIRSSFGIDAIAPKQGEIIDF